MNKLGFTLVEVLCVVTILSLLMIFVTPNIINLVKNNKNSVEDIQKEMIVSATKMYIEECSNTSLSKECNFVTTGTETEINLSDLVSNGYIDEIKNDNNVCKGKIIKKDNNYEVILNC